MCGEDLGGISGAWQAIVLGDCGLLLLSGEWSMVRVWKLEWCEETDEIWNSEQYGGMPEKNDWDRDMVCGYFGVTSIG